MNTKRKWYELLLPGLAVLLVLAVGAVQTAKAEYNENTGNYTDKSSTVDEDESTYMRQLTTVATATVQTTSCHASLVNYVWTKGSTKSLYGYAESWVRKDWTWYGEDDAPGGTLTWSYHAEGKPSVSGENDIPTPATQSATSVATADSDTSATLTLGGPAWVSADANGYVIDDGASGGDYSIHSDPTASITDSGKTTGGSSYVVFVEYEIDDSGVETIPEFTEYIYVRCDTEVAAYAFCSSSGGAESEAFITSSADADCDASFVSN